MKTDNIQQDISNKPIMKLANDLQKKLSDKEYEILALKDSELSLKRELFQLKENNLHLKNSNTLLNHRSNRPKSVSIEFNEGKAKYTYGIIDFLTRYGYTKRLERAFTILLNPKSSAEASVINPKKYEKRFINFILRRVLEKKL